MRAVRVVAGTLVVFGCGCSTVDEAPPRPETANVKQTLLDSSVCPPGSNIIVGTAGDDVLEGTSGADCILGGDGDDVIHGGGGDDVLIGGAGDDAISGGNGRDLIHGEDGNDQLQGDNGKDRLFGGSGNDILIGGNGQDELDGGEGNDVLIGENGKDTLSGGEGDDAIDSGNDVVSGGTETTVSFCSSDSDCAAGFSCLTSGVCVACFGDGECDDGNVCTTEVCTPLIGCSNPARADGTLCLDDDVCNGEETCQSAVCTDGPPLECDDGLFCTGEESCEPIAGCVDGTPPEIDDGNECTEDSCNETRDVVENVLDYSLCDELFGWADLHTHPASHLAFSALPNGNNGIFYGSPGLALESSDVTTDLPPCAADVHTNRPLADLVEHETRALILRNVDNVSGFANHGGQGANDFQHWPHARSLNHQQMHVTAVHRAYEGGMRMMIASVTNNELLSKLWRTEGDPCGNTIPLPTPGYDYNSALRQIEFIRDQLVPANSDWMEIADSAGHAREIIANDKLAIVLSIEMDNLTPEETLMLVRDEGARHVVPVHLINNDVGGTALYDASDIFNTVNAFVHSPRGGGPLPCLVKPKKLFQGHTGYFQVDWDELLHVTLSRPDELRNVLLGDFIPTGGIGPSPVSDEVYDALSYESPSDAWRDAHCSGPDPDPCCADSTQCGHKNEDGLYTAGRDLIRELAQEGVLIDVAHMSEKATEDTLALLSFPDYPVMSSHTGMRGSTGHGHSERELKWEHAVEMGDRGGVVGLGTEGTSGLVSILKREGAPWKRFTGTDLFFGPAEIGPVPGANAEISHLTVAIVTGGDDLRGGVNRVWARVTLAGDEVYEVDLSRGRTWTTGDVRIVSFQLPPGTRENDVQFGLRTAGNLLNDPILDDEDNWDVAKLEVFATRRDRDAVQTWIDEYEGALVTVGDGGVAFGSDINGLAPQLPFAAHAVSYPIDASRRFGNPEAPSLDRAQMGSRSFDFETDGVAHMGMMADFVQAISERPDAEDATTALFQSAGKVVQMWERCEELAPLVP